MISRIVGNSGHSEMECHTRETIAWRDEAYIQNGPRAVQRGVVSFCQKRIRQHLTRLERGLHVVSGLVQNIFRKRLRILELPSLDLQGSIIQNGVGQDLITMDARGLV